MLQTGYQENKGLSWPCGQAALLNLLESMKGDRKREALHFTNIVAVLFNIAEIKFSLNS